MDNYRQIPQFPMYHINRQGIVMRKEQTIINKNSARRYYPSYEVAYKRSYMGDKKYFLRKNNKSHFVFASDLIKSAFSINEIVTQSENEND